MAECIRLVTREEMQRAIQFGEHVKCNENGTSVYRYDGHDYVITSDHKEQHDARLDGNQEDEPQPQGLR